MRIFFTLLKDNLLIIVERDVCIYIVHKFFYLTPHQTLNVLCFLCIICECHFKHVDNASIVCVTI